MLPFYVISSEHNYLYLSQFDICGTGPRWCDEQYMQAWETREAAEAVLSNMHPDYRARLKPEVLEAIWVYCPKAQAEVLAVR